MREHLSDSCDKAMTTSAADCSTRINDARLHLAITARCDNQATSTQNAIDRSIDDTRRGDLVVAQGGEEGERTPAALRNLAQPSTTFPNLGMTFSNEMGAQSNLSRDRPAFAVIPNLRECFSATTAKAVTAGRQPTWLARCFARASHRMALGEFLKMHEANVGTSDLVESRAAASGASISTERRLLGWAVTLAGAALMVSGATIVILSVL
jgi:hypothetical protein